MLPDHFYTEGKGEPDISNSHGMCYLYQWEYTGR